MGEASIRSAAVGEYDIVPDRIIRECGKPKISNYVQVR